MENFKLSYCPNCLGNGYKDNVIRYKDTILPVKYYTICNGFVDFHTKHGAVTNCIQCNTPLIQLSLTVEEWRIIQKTSTDPNFVFALNKLKQENIIEFNVKMAQFRQTAESIEQTKELQHQLAQQMRSSNTPKCPTCGSTNIKKISATKRWVGTGLFGIASSDMGKTMQCNNCGYKW